MTQYNDWQAFLVRTIDGVVGPSIKIKEGSKYSISLSNDTSASFSLDKSDLPEVDLSYWLDAWWSSLLITFEGRAIFFGPIISNPREYAHEVQFDCTDIRGLLERRYVISEEALRSPNIANNVIKYKGLSLGTISQEVVKVGMEKPGGNLPIRFMSPRESVVDDADHQRTYKAFEITNLSVDAVLTKLSNVGGGPDIVFRPKMVHDSQVVWEMYHGTEYDPRIKQDRIPQFDLTAEKGQTASLEITKTATYMADRFITTGGGTNEATAMSIWGSTSRIDRKYPFLESVLYVSDTTNKSVLKRHAETNVKRNSKPLKEFTLFVDAYGTNPFGTYWPGDLLELYVKGYFNLPDGSHKMRLLNMSGEFGSNKIRLAMQLDDQWDL